MKKKLLLPILILLLAITTATVGVYAWFIGGNTTVSNITFNTGVVDVDFSLHLVQDFNNDGIPDQTMQNVGTVDNPQFELLETLVDIKEQGIIIENAIPGMVYTYRLTAYNNANKECFIAIRNENAASSILNNALTFNTILNEKNEDETITVKDIKISLRGTRTLIADEQYAPDSAMTSGKMPMITIPENLGEGYEPLVFEFQIKFEHLDVLKNWTETTDLFADKTNLNDFMGQKLFDTQTNTGSRFYVECRQGKSGL